jgi:predicted adenylyl cyclase CyaB
MNTELEKKYKIQDCSLAKQELGAMGAQFVGESRDIDVYFQVPQDVPNTRYLRVRTRGYKSTLAFHQVIDDLETKEWETDVSDGKITQDIIAKLGFEIDVVVDKTRQRYNLDDSEIVLDHIENLGYFLEIESPTEEQLDSIAAKLTLGERITGKGYPDLLKDQVGR